MRPLTNETPKCLLPIGGKPLVQIWLELLWEHGVREVLVNTHWRREKVERFLSADSADYADEKQIKGFGDLGIKELEEGKEKRGKSKERELNKDWPVIHLFYETELLGSAGTLLANKDWVGDDEPFFIIYGDNLTNVNLSAMLTFHRQHGLPFTLGVFKTERPRDCGIAEVDKEGVVTGFAEKPENPKSDLAAAGVYVANQDIFDFFPEDAESIRPLDLGFHVIPNLVGKMKAYFIEEFLMDIGTVDSYEKAQIIWPQIGKRI